jgi:hypothetical protein
VQICRPIADVLIIFTWSPTNPTYACLVPNQFCCHMKFRPSAFSDRWFSELTTISLFCKQSIYFFNVQPTFLKEESEASEITMLLVCPCVKTLILVTVTEWYRKKRTMQLRLYSDLLCSHPSSNHPPVFPVLVAAETPSREAGRYLGDKRPLNVAYQYLSYHKGYLTSVKFYDMGQTALFPLRRQTY